jgi:hypothetical protein
MNRQLCYMCSRPKTSREHVPPLCMFPEQKDAEANENYRMELIRVPSCDEHNSKKQKDDEFLFFVLTLSIANNQAAKQQGNTKILRAVTRNPELPSAFFSQLSPAFAVENNCGTPIPASLAKIDYQRFLRAMDRVVRGIYFHHFGTRFTGRCSIFNDFMLQYSSPDGALQNHQNHQIAMQLRAYFDNVKELGANPEVFCYAALPPDERGLIGCRLKFFEHSSVFVAYIPAAVGA